MDRSGRRTTARRDLARNAHFEEVSPEVGELDEAAFDDLMAEDPDAALSLLADLAGATDRGLADAAHRLAGRVLVDLARVGTLRRTGVGRLRTRRGGEGDLDVDASLEVLLEASALRRAPHAEEVSARAWGRPEVAACLCVDRSGSMTGGRLATAAVAAAAVVLRHPRAASVVAFSDRAVVLRSPTEERDPESVVTDLLRLRGHGTTDLALALTAAQRQLEGSPASRRVTVLLSDCRHTAGADPEAMAAALDELVILAPEGDSDEAERLARAVGARCTTVSGPADIPAALSRVLSPG